MKIFAFAKSEVVEHKMKKMSVFRRLLNICPYTHLWDVIKTAVREREFPNSAAKQGAIVMLLGICCPLFWVSLFRGASAAELRFNAIHSGIVALLGLVIMIAGFLKKDI